MIQTIVLNYTLNCSWYEFIELLLQQKMQTFEEKTQRIRSAIQQKLLLHRKSLLKNNETAIKIGRFVIHLHYGECTVYNLKHLLNE